MELGFLLFSSMLKPTEMYLSKEIKNKPTKTKAKKLNTQKAKFLDNEIEAAMQEANNKRQKSIIDKLLAKETTQDSDSINAIFESSENNKFEEVKSAFKNLYHNFIGYAKKTYATMSTKSKKIIEGPVRITAEKFVKVWQYILAAINPQWNMPTLSKFDYDTLSPAVTSHTTINEESFKYNPAYAVLRYRSE